MQCRAVPRTLRLLRLGLAGSSMAGSSSSPKKCFSSAKVGMLRSRALSFSSSMYPALGKLTFLACRGREAGGQAGGEAEADWGENDAGEGGDAGGSQQSWRGAAHGKHAGTHKESLPACPACLPCLPHLVRCRHLVCRVEGAPDHRDVSHQRHVPLVAVGGQVVVAQPARDGGDDLDLQQKGGGVWEGGNAACERQAGGRAADMGQTEAVRGPPVLLISLTRGLLYGSVPALFWMPKVCAGRWSS